MFDWSWHAMRCKPATLLLPAILNYPQVTYRVQVNMWVNLQDLHLDLWVRVSS